MSAIQIFAEQVQRALLLVSDADARQTSFVARSAAMAGWRTIVCKDVKEAFDALGSASLHVSAILLDAKVIEGEIEPAISRLKNATTEAAILLLSEEGLPTSLVDILRDGADDILFKPLTADQLLHALRSATAGRWHDDRSLEPFAATMDGPSQLSGLVGDDHRFRIAVAKAAVASRGSGHVLIEGESATGKHTLARAMLAGSNRAEKNSVRTLNARSASNSTLESLLFGHEPGAFIGAFARKDGLLKLCDGGVLIIEEINRLAVPIQDRLAEVLSTQSLRPMGGRAGYPLNVRVIGLSNIPLAPSIEKGAFSEALYDILGATRVWLPPLRERIGDLGPIARFWLNNFTNKDSVNGMVLTGDAVAVLSHFSWPGNIAQLQSVVARAVASATSHILSAENFAHFPELARKDGQETEEIGRHRGGEVMLFGVDGHIRNLSAIETDVIRLAVSHYGGRLTKVARHLGISRSTLYRKLGLFE